MNKDTITPNKVSDNIYTPFIALNEADVVKQAAQKIPVNFRGEVENEKIRFPKELGCEHPFNFKVAEGIFKKFGFANAVVNKFIDFVVGPGFFAESDDERATEIIEQFMEDVNFDTLLRAWLKEALVKGNGFLEIGGKKDEAPQGLKVLNANWMYVDRDDKGVVEGFNQYTGGFKRLDKSKITPFKTFQIAHLAFNKIGDDAYGLGMISPALATIDSLLGNKKSLNMLMDRKANSPYHVKMGGVHGGKYYKPSAADVTKMGKDFEWLNNKHEWITDGLTDISVLDFGNFGDKFEFILKSDIEMLIFTFQVPAVLMGMANINEGIAKVQMDAFERRISSIQAEAEKVIENELFKRVLNANGFDVHVEFQWGRPSNTEMTERLLKLKDIAYSPLASESIRTLAEKEMVKLFEFDEEEYETLLAEEEIRKEEERKREEERQQPLVPGQNASQPPRPKPKQPQPRPTRSMIDKCPHCENIKEGDYSKIEEWLGFNYKEYLGKIIEAVRDEEFDDLRAITEIEKEAGKLSERQIEELKNVLEDGFRKGKSIKEITKAVEKKVKPQDLLKVEDGVIALAAGIPIVLSKSKNRSLSIARSEITRTANAGAIRHYKSKGIENVRWVASFGPRTCPECEALDGRVFSVNDLPPLPFHNMCRCMTVSVTEVL